MKLPITIAILLIAAASTSTFAADEARPPMKPHSHVQEKTGVAPPAPASEKKAGEPPPSPEKQQVKKRHTKKHFHPRDK